MCRKLCYMLNVNRMRILREISARGTIAAAAEALFMTPSAVSQQMAVLEREAGSPLLERAGRGVRLTEAGRRLVMHTERVLSELEAAEAELAAVTSGVAGKLDLCAFPTAARMLMVPALALLRERHTRLTFSLVDLEPQESIPELKSGNLDVVLTHEYDRLPTVPESGVDRHELMTEPLSLAVPASHPLAEGPARMSDFREEQWIVGRERTPFLDVVVRVAHEAGFEPNVDLHSDDYQVILSLVGAGLGVAFVPPMALMTDYPNVRFRQLDDIQVTRRIAAAIRSGSETHPAIGAVLEALHVVAEQRQRETRSVA